MRILSGPRHCSPQTQSQKPWTPIGHFVGRPLGVRSAVVVGDDVTLGSVLYVFFFFWVELSERCSARQVA